MTPIWQPLPGPQTAALNSPADILFYGGAAGGGKTDLVLGAALERHRKSIIFRREYPQLRDIIDRSRELIGDKGNLNENLHIWRNLPRGNTIELGAMHHEHDKNNYKGRAHDLKAFDEITEFSESQFRFVIGWMRTTVANQRTRVICTGNPPTTSNGEWIIRFWAPWLDETHPNPAAPGELRWFARINGEDIEVENGEPFSHNGELIKPMSRTFIPAALRDNPYLMQTDYGTTLQNLPEPLRSQLLHGLFNVKREDDPWQVIPTEWIKLAQKRWRNSAGVANRLDQIGVDVARGGRDKTVIAKRYGTWFAPLAKYAGIDTPDGPSAAAKVSQEIDGEPVINVDVIGVGSSVYDILQANELTVNGVNNAAASGYEDYKGRQIYAFDRTGKLKLKNKRAEGYWKLREALDPVHGDNLALPDDPELLGDLCAPRWKLTTQGIQIESKEDLIERLGRSPDCGDAIVLAHLIIIGKKRRTAGAF